MLAPSLKDEVSCIVIAHWAGSRIRYVYGSAASGTDSVGSDIALAVRSDLIVTSQGFGVNRVGEC